MPRRSLSELASLPSFRNCTIPNTLLALGCGQAAVSFARGPIYGAISPPLSETSRHPRPGRPVSLMSLGAIQVGKIGASPKRKN